MKLICYALSTFLIFAPLSAVLAKAPETAKSELDQTFVSKKDLTITKKCDMLLISSWQA